MNKILTLLLTATFLLSASSCGTQPRTDYDTEQTADFSDVSETNTSLSYKTVSDKNYIIEIPDTFEEYHDESDHKTWVPKGSADEHENYISVTDIGHLTYATESDPPEAIPLPEQFDEIGMIRRTLERAEEGVKCEEIFFDRNDGDDYEEFAYMAKYTYSEGSDFYSSYKLGVDISNISIEGETKEQEELKDEIVVYYGGKAIVDKKDRSRVINVTTTAHDEKYLSDMENSIRSFEWKN